MENEYLLQVALELKDQMSKNLEEVNRELVGFKKDLKAAGIDVDNLGEKVQKNSVNMKGALASLAKTAKYTTAALTGIATISIKNFADIEYSVKKVQTVSSKSFDEIKTNAYDLAKTYGISIGEILEANYDLISAMGDIKDGHLVLDQAAQLSMAGFTSLGGAVNAITSIMNAYKMEATEVTRVSDILMATQNNGKIVIKELEDALSDVVPTAASMGIAFEDVAATLATMTLSGEPVTKATTKFRSALAELAKEGTSANKKFKQLSGVTFLEFIKKGGDVADAFELIREGAEKSNITMYDFFGSQEAAGSVLMTTGENMETFRKVQEATAKSAGTTKKAVDGLSDAFKIEFGQLKAVMETATGKIGEELIPYVKELKEAIDQIDFKEILSKENIDYAIELGKGILGVSAALWGIDKAIKAVEISAKAATGLKMLMNLLVANPVTVALTGAVGGTALLLNKANDEFENRKKEYEKLQSDIEGERKILEELKKSLSSNLMDDDKLDNAASILRYTEGFESLKKTLADGEIEEALKEIDDLITNLATKSITAPVPELPKENPLDSKPGKKGFSNKGLGNLDDKDDEKIKKIKNILQEFKDLTSNVEKKAIAFDMSELQKAEEELKSMESILSDALQLKLDKKSLDPMINQYKEFKDKVNNLKDEIDFKQVKENFEKEFTNLNIGFEIFGTEEEERLLQTIRILESQISKAISEGMMGEASELGKSLKELKEKYKVEYELPKKAQRNLDDSMKNLSTSIYQIADVVGGDFLETVSAMINGIDVVRKSLEVLGSGSDGKSGDVTGGFGSIFGNVGSFMGSEASKQMFDKIGASLAIAGAVGGMVSSIFGKSDEKRKKKNAENEKKFEENTNALKELGEQLKANTATLQDFANTLIASISTSPTLHRIAGGQNALQLMEDVMMENKDFGQLSFLVKESKKNWRGKRKSYSKNREMSENELLGLMGYDPTLGIDEFDLDQLKQFAKDLDNVTESIVRGWADSLTSRKIESIDMSGFDQYKDNVDEFIRQIEMLQKEQKELFRNATLEGFEGINVLDEKQLTEQYKQMFNDMGIDANKYTETIKEMVDSNKVLVSSMEDVRSQFIESLITGEESFTNSMGSYFQKIIKNAAMTVYDTLYSEVDNSMNEMFKKMADKLVDMKESGKVDFTGFWNDFDFAEILKAQDIESNFQVVIDDLRNQLLNMGIGEEIIDSFLPITTAQQKINELKDKVNNGLSSAMSQALGDKDFGSFEKSLGQSIYTSVKDSLVKAFTDSETYKQLINKYFDFADIEKELNGITNPKEAFEMMQDYLNKLYGKLEANGMGGFENSTSGNKQEDNKLGNSYFSDGPSQININITQNFSGVYGEGTMYKIAKKGTMEALEEAKNQSKVLGVM